MKRLLAGYVVAAFALPALALAFGSVGLAILGAWVTVSTTLVLGIPASIELQKRGLLDVGHFFAAGVIAGCISALVFSVIVSEIRAFLFFGGIFMVFGALHGVVFWLVAIRGNTALRDAALLRR